MDRLQRVLEEYKYKGVLSDESTQWVLREIVRLRSVLYGQVKTNRDGK